MSDTPYRNNLGIDRDALLAMGVVPALATVVAMFVAFLVVTGLLFVAEGVLVGSALTQWLTLAVIYIVPHFVVGVGMGTRHGLAVAPPVVIALTPIAALMVAFAAFGGPVLTPFRSPLLTLGAVAVWGVVAAVGVLFGGRVLSPWVADR